MMRFYFFLVFSLFLFSSDLTHDDSLPSCCAASDGLTLTTDSMNFMLWNHAPYKELET